jgi:hypothetical protein
MMLVILAVFVLVTEQAYIYIYNIFNISITYINKYYIMNNFHQDWEPVVIRSKNFALAKNKEAHDANNRWPIFIWWFF